MKSLRVQVKGVEASVHILSVDKVEQKEGRLLVYRGNEVVGQFALHELVGWWYPDQS